MTRQPAGAPLALASATVGGRQEAAGARAGSAEAAGPEASTPHLEGEVAQPDAEQGADLTASGTRSDGDGHSYSHFAREERDGRANGVTVPPVRWRAWLAGGDALSPGLRGLGVYAKLVWMAGFAVLVLGALVYPVFATNARTNNYQQRAGLDGAQFLTTLYPGDAAAIRWINAHVEGDPVIVEATGGEYTDFARVSTFTGLPTVLGWGGHEVQWRVNWLTSPANAYDFNRRGADLDTIYTSTNAGLVKQLLQHYHASYLYVGALEQQKYSAQTNLSHFSQPPFSQFLEAVYQAGGVTIYEIS